MDLETLRASSAKAAEQLQGRLAAAEEQASEGCDLLP